MAVLDEISLKLEGTVRQAMTEEVYRALSSRKVGEVTELMAERNLRRIIVIDERDQVVGVVSQRDILRHYLAADRSSSEEETAPPSDTEIGALVTRETPITIPPDTPLIKAAMVLAANKIGCLPVIGPRRDLAGLVTITDVLRHVSGVQNARLEQGFEFYAPATAARGQMPAYIRKTNGELVVPLDCLSNKHAPMDLALLGYDQPSGRILVKFLPECDDEPAAFRTRQVDGMLVIPATEFVTHHQLAGKTSAFDVTDHHNTRYLLLTPRQRL